MKKHELYTTQPVDGLKLITGVLGDCMCLARGILNILSDIALNPKP